jgi:hypothetical protein
MMSKTLLLTAAVLALGISSSAQANETAPGLVRPRAAAAAIPAWCRQKGYVRRWQGGALSARQAARCANATAPRTGH